MSGSGACRCRKPTSYCSFCWLSQMLLASVKVSMLQCSVKTNPSSTSWMMAQSGIQQHPCVTLHASSDQRKRVKLPSRLLKMQQRNRSRQGMDQSLRYMSSSLLNSNKLSTHSSSSNRRSRNMWLKAALHIARYSQLDLWPSSSPGFRQAPIAHVTVPAQLLCHSVRVMQQRHTSVPECSTTCLTPALYVDILEKFHTCLPYVAISHSNLLLTSQ